MPAEPHQRASLALSTGLHVALFLAIAVLARMHGPMLLGGSGGEGGGGGGGTPGDGGGMELVSVKMLDLPAGAPPAPSIPDPPSREEKAPPPPAEDEPADVPPHTKPKAIKEETAPPEKKLPKEKPAEKVTPKPDPKEAADAAEAKRAKEKQAKEAAKKEAEKKAAKEKEAKDKREKEEAAKKEADRKAAEAKKLAEQKAKEEKAKKDAFYIKPSAKVLQSASDRLHPKSKNDKPSSSVRSALSPGAARAIKGHNPSARPGVSGIVGAGNGSRVVAGTGAGSGLGLGTGFGSGSGNGIGTGNGDGTGGVGLPDYYCQQALAKVARAFKLPPDKKADAIAVLSVRIGRDGILSGIKVAKSSGRGDLDDFAVKALETTRNFAPFPDHVRENSLEAEIIFSFTD